MNLEIKGLVDTLPVNIPMDNQLFECNVLVSLEDYSKILKGWIPLGHGCFMKGKLNTEGE